MVRTHDGRGSHGLTDGRRDDDEKGQEVDLFAPQVVTAHAEEHLQATDLFSKCIDKD